MQVLVDPIGTLLGVDLSYRKPKVRVSNFYNVSECFHFTLSVTVIYSFRINADLGIDPNLPHCCPAKITLMNISSMLASLTV